jgi:hypothetical protein
MISWKELASKMVVMIQCINCPEMEFSCDIGDVCMSHTLLAAWFRIVNNLHAKTAWHLVRHCHILISSQFPLLRSELFFRFTWISSTIQNIRTAVLFQESASERLWHWPRHHQWVIYFPTHLAGQIVFGNPSMMGWYLYSMFSLPWYLPCLLTHCRQKMLFNPLPPPLIGWKTQRICWGVIFTQGCNIHVRCK